MSTSRGTSASQLSMFSQKRMKMNRRAAELANSRQLRSCADTYKEWFELERTMPSHPSLEPSCVYYALHGYSSMFRYDDLPPSDSDFSFLKSVTVDEDAMACERAHAAYSLGHIYWMRSQREEALKALRKVVKFAATPSERKKKVQGVQGPGLVSVGALLDEDLRNANEKITELMQASSMSNVTYSMGGVSRPAAPSGDRACVSHSIPIGPNAPRKLTESILTSYTKLSQKITGTNCDLCGASPSDVTDGKIVFPSCQTCRRAAYCGKECQTSDWKRHKLSCRPPKEFKAGDLVRLQGLVSKPELNGTIEVAGLAEESEGRWRLHIIGAEVGFGMNVKPENMHLIVPVEEREELK